MEEFGFASVSAIVVIVYLIGLMFKSIKNPTVDKFIPVISGISGLILGVASYFIAPEIISADNIFTAAAVGIVSGLASTGINQVYKQLTK